MTVDSLLDSMPASELFKWFEWYKEREESQKKEPEPEEKDWENMTPEDISGTFGL